mmetsp:Transcript_7888/g.19880  ORF Transcript_7888/g.19880 Transcript_7888/m.19880 type:complete len:570 (+) Transcript_7888:196-1905(+)
MQQRHYHTLSSEDDDEPRQFSSFDVEEGRHTSENETSVLARILRWKGRAREFIEVVIIVGVVFTIVSALLILPKVERQIEDAYDQTEQLEDLLDNFRTELANTTESQKDVLQSLKTLQDSGTTIDKLTQKISEANSTLGQLEQATHRGSQTLDDQALVLQDKLTRLSQEQTQQLTDAMHAVQEKEAAVSAIVQEVRDEKNATLVSGQDLLHTMQKERNGTLDELAAAQAAAAQRMNNTLQQLEEEKAAALQQVTTQKEQAVNELQGVQAAAEERMHSTVQQLVDEKAGLKDDVILLVNTQLSTLRANFTSHENESKKLLEDTKANIMEDVRQLVDARLKDKSVPRVLHSYTHSPCVVTGVTGGWRANCADQFVRPHFGHCSATDGESWEFFFNSTHVCGNVTVSQTNCPSCYKPPPFDHDCSHPVLFYTDCIVCGLLSYEWTSCQSWQGSGLTPRPNGVLKLKDLGKLTRSQVRAQYTLAEIATFTKGGPCELLSVSEDPFFRPPYCNETQIEQLKKANDLFDIIKVSSFDVLFWTSRREKQFGHGFLYVNRPLKSHPIPREIGPFIVF